MRHSLFIMLVGVLISTVAFAGEMPGPNEGPANAGEPESVIGAPAALHLKIVATGFQLNWTLSPQDSGAVTGYELVRADRFSGPFDLVATPGKGTAEFIDTTASPEIIYYYKVRAIAGKEHSPFSNMAAGER